MHYKNSKCALWMCTVFHHIQFHPYIIYLFIPLWIFYYSLCAVVLFWVVWQHRFMFKIIRLICLQNIDVFSSSLLQTGFHWYEHFSTRRNNYYSTIFRADSKDSSHLPERDHHSKFPLKMHSRAAIFKSIERNSRTGNKKVIISNWILHIFWPAWIEAVLSAFVFFISFWF